MNLGELYYLIIFFFAIRTLKVLIYESYVWQLKEFRLDRFISFLKTRNGVRLIFHPLNIIKWLSIISPLLVVRSERGLYLWIFLTVIAFSLFWYFESIFWFLELARGKARFPKFTPRALLIFISTSILMLIFYLYNNSEVFTLIALDRLLPIFIFISVILSAIPKRIIEFNLYSQAKRKIENFEKIVVIGITGSIGKTSTKEFLAKLLEAKYKVQKTPESINTQIGIARFIIDQLKSDTEIFIVEMGAYKKGEIKAICNMVRPHIGIITYIGTQHLELFGSVQNLKDAKYELIENLPGEGLALFNGENEECRELAKKAEESGKKILLYGLNKEDVRVYKDKVEFTTRIKNKGYKFTTNLLGEQVITNILGAIAVAYTLGLTPLKIKAQVSKISSPRHTMDMVGRYKGAQLIDDTFNASRESVLSALDYMKIYKGKKILILSPLIELGSQENNIYTEIINKAQSICDLIIKTNTLSPSLLKQKIDQLVSQDSVIVFEGKESAKYLKQLL